MERQVGEENGKGCVWERKGDKRRRGKVGGRVRKRGEREREERERSKRKEKKGQERKKARSATPPEPSRELARKNLKPEGHIIQNQKLNLIVSRPCPPPLDE